MKVVKGFTSRSLKNAADVLMFPFEEIVNSVSVILAMSYGKAVIAPDMGNMPETTDKKAGFLYDRNDKSGLFNALNKALNYDLISMCKNNYDKAKSFDWEMIAQKTYEIYKECNSTKFKLKI